MTDEAHDAPIAPAASWRLIEPTDIPFVYQLVAAVDPRWWRFSRFGLEPAQLLQTTAGIPAGAIVLDEAGRPVAAAILADVASVGTAGFEFYALPLPAAEALARRFAPDLIVAAFEGAELRRLYYERFQNDADVLGEFAALFEVEVTMPEFAMIDGAYEDRTTSVLTAERLTQWRQAATR
ncbi:hypothetical protein BH10ACT2_BH10ACT2_02210 [soil metagenome]